MYLSQNDLPSIPLTLHPTQIYKNQAFLSKRLALLLLGCTALTLLLFLRKWLAAAPASTTKGTVVWIDMCVYIRTPL